MKLLQEKQGEDRRRLEEQFRAEMEVLREQMNNIKITK